MKKKYEKPTSKNLSSLEIAQGSCRTGNVEYTITDICVSGATAFEPCNTGSIVVGDTFCNPLGNHAGYSCVNGHTAG